MSTGEYARLRELVRRGTGLDFPPSRRSDLERAIEEGRRDAGLDSAEAFLRLLLDSSKGAAALDAWVPRLTIGETHFFRNRPQMDALRTRILPDIIARAGSSKRLRIWSAACSSGEEPYTIAMLLDEVLGDLSGWKISIVGTDIDPHALEKARRAVYGAWSFREVPEASMQRYFTRRGDRFEVVPRIREMVTFRRLNLVTGSYPSQANGTDQLDLIMCRNVLIYFDAETIAGVLASLHKALAPGGWLVPGHAEPSTETFRRYEACNFPGAIVYRRAQREAPAPPSRPPSARRCPRPAGLPGERPSVLAPRTPAPFPTFSGVERRRPQFPGAVRSAPLSRPGSPSGPPPATDAVAAEVAEAAAVLGRGLVDEAIRRLEAVADRAPGDAQAPFLLAKALSSRLRLDEAERWIDTALAQDRLRPAAHHLRGLILAEQGRLDEALESHRRAVYADPDFVLGHFALAGLFGRLGQPARAAKALENAARLLEGVPASTPVPEGDGLTAGRLRDLVALQRSLAA